MNTQIDLPRFSKGKRPNFFDSEGTEHLLAMVLELATELAVVYNRVDRLERSLIEAGGMTREALDGFEFSADALREQDGWANLLLDRLYSSVQQQSQTLTPKSSESSAPLTV